MLPYLAATTTATTTKKDSALSENTKVDVPQKQEGGWSLVMVS